MDRENKARERIVEVGDSLYRRGLSPGSSGNISARLDDGWLVTPTNSCLGALDPAKLAKLDWNGQHLSQRFTEQRTISALGDVRKRPASHAIVHLHSTYSAAVSCLDGLNSTSCIPPITPYFVIKSGDYR